MNPLRKLIVCSLIFLFIIVLDKADDKREEANTTFPDHIETDPSIDKLEKQFKD